MFHTPKNVMALYLTTAVAVASQPALSAMFNNGDQGNQNQQVTFGNSLVDAADYGDVNSLKSLLKAGQDPNQRGDFSTTALLRAAYRGNVEVVKALLLAGADPNLADIGGATPLHVASREGHKQVVDILLRSGATVNVADAEGYTPLMRATMQNEEDVFNDLLAQGANINAKTELGETVVEQAAKTKNQSLVGRLLAMEEESAPLPMQVADLSQNTQPDEQMVSELTPASSWSEAVSSQLFGSEFMLMAIADTNMASKGSFNMLDFGSYKSEEEAKKKLEELKSKYSDSLKGLNVVVVEKNSGENKAYHINAGLLDTKEEAVSRCKSLVSKGVVCRPVETKMMISELTAPKATASKPLPPTDAEAAPAEQVEKAELPAIDRFHAPKEEMAKAETKAEVKTSAKVEAIDSPLIEKAATKPANVETKTAAVDTAKLPVVASEASKEVKAETKTEGNIGKFDVAKKDEKEEDSFFGSLFGDDKPAEEAKPVAKPEIKAQPKEVAKLEVAPKPVAAAPALPKLTTSTPTSSLPKLPTSNSEVAATKDLPVVAKSVPAEPVVQPVKQKEVEAKELVVKDAAKNAPTKNELDKTEGQLNPLVMTKQQIQKDSNTNPFKLTDNTDETARANAEIKKSMPRAAVIESKATPVKTSEKVVLSESKKSPSEMSVVSNKSNLQIEVSEPAKKASDTLKPLPPLKTSTEVALKPAPKQEAQLTVAKMEEPKTPVLKPAPEKMRTEELSVPNTLAVTATPPVVAAQPQIPVIAPANPAPAPVVAYAPPPPPPAPPVAAEMPQHIAQAPVQPVYPTANTTTVVVSKKARQQQLAAAPMVVAPAPAQYAPQPVMNPAVPVPVYTPAPVAMPAPAPAPVAVAPAPAPVQIAQTPIATPAPNSFVAPNQVVVQKNGSQFTEAYTPPSQPGYLGTPQQQVTNPYIANNFINPQPIPGYYQQAPVQMQYQQPLTERESGKEMYVSVGYFTTQSAARGFWNRVSATNSDVLPKFRMKTRRPASNSGRVTAEIGPIYSSAEANNVCNIMSTEGLACEIISPLRQAGSPDKYRNFMAGQRHSDLSSAAGDYGTVGDEIANGSYNSWAVQLGTFDSKEAARNTWEMLREKNRALSKLDPNISSNDTSSRVRLRAGKFTSAEAAQSVCEELRRNYISCILVRS